MPTIPIILEFYSDSATSEILLAVRKLSRYDLTLDAVIYKLSIPRLTIEDQNEPVG